MINNLRAFCSSENLLLNSLSITDHIEKFACIFAVYLMLIFITGTWPINPLSIT